MDDGRELIHEQYPELGLDFFLQEVSDEWDGIESRGNLKRLKRIISKDNRNSLLF